MSRIRIATRKSELALWQANHVADLLRAAHPGIEVELLPMVTRGDIILDQPLARIGGKGLFLKELERALLRDEADIAVGNVIGSNIFNIAAILGVSALVGPLPVSESLLVRELPAVVIMSLLVFPMLRTRWSIDRWEGALLLGGYVALGTWLL